MAPVYIIFCPKNYPRSRGALKNKGELPRSSPFSLSKKPRRVRGSDAANPIQSIFRRHVRRKITLKRGVTPRSRADQGGQRPPRWSASIPSTVKEHGPLTVEGTLALHRGRHCLPWSARGRGICRASGRFSAAHVAGKSIQSYSRLASRELCEAS